MAKQKQNAYSLFVRDQHRKMQREGKNPQYQSLFKELDPVWRSLSEAERNKYKDRAKQPQSNYYPQTSNRPADGPQDDLKPLVRDLTENKVDIKRPHSEIEWHEDEVCEQQEKRMKPAGIPNHWKGRQVDPERYQDIELVRIRERCKAIISSRANSLISTPLYAFSTNVLCFKSGIYVPIEIGICAYSVKKGKLCEPYHALIDAGPPLEACINLASDHAETHKITIPPRDSYPSVARKDYRKIYREIVEYTKAGERTILVWSLREMQQIIGCLEWLYEKASQQYGPGKIPKVSTWTVLPVMEFVANMCNFVHQNMLHNDEPVFIIHYYINMLLEISVHDYDRDLMCEYHKTVVSKWCAKSCASRMFLTIERVFEEIHKGFMLAVNPEFLRAKMAPLLYHQHRPSQQFLSDQANASSTSEPAQPLARSQGSEEHMLALPAPDQATTSEAVTARMAINDDTFATSTSAATEVQQPEIIPDTTASTTHIPTLRDPRISA